MDASSKKFCRTNNTIISFDERRFQALEKSKKTFKKQLQMPWVLANQLCEDGRKAVANAMGVSQSTV